VSVCEQGERQRERRSRHPQCRAQSHHLEIMT